MDIIRQWRIMRMLGVLWLSTLSLGACSTGATVPQSIRESHVDANIPAEADFAVFLQRDLQTYFSTTYGTPVSITYTLLRSAPTQSGMSFPSFYAWVTISDTTHVIDEGAVEVDALYKEYFEVTEYMSRTAILQNSENVYRNFPQPVGDTIMERVK